MILNESRQIILIMDVNCQRCFINVAVPSRLKILELLKSSNRDLTVNEVVKNIKLRQPTVTFHLKKLANAGIISKQKRGREAYLRLTHLTSKCRTCPVFN